MVRRRGLQGLLLGLVQQIIEAWVQDRGNFADQRFVEQNIETHSFFLEKTDVGLVAPFSDVTEALGRVPHIFWCSRSFRWKSLPLFL